jgi:putative flippase GtrA
MENSRPDVFDRIMARRLLRPLRPFYEKYKEPLLYLFFGGLTTLLSIFLYWLFAHPLGVPPLAANVVSWILCVAFAYVTNRTWVFKDKARGPRGILREAASFTVGRLATLGLEELILWLGISVLAVNDLLVKIVAQVLVIVGNYVISKFLVFKKD